MDQQRAREIVSALAHGADPFTGAPLPADSICNHAEVVRALYALLGASASGKKPKQKKKEFYLTEEQKRQFAFSATPIPVSELTKRLNELADPEACFKLTYPAIVAWLLEIGALELVTAADGKSSKRPTDQGETLGIRLEYRAGQYGEYTVITYDQEAQQFILDHLEAIAALTAEKRPSNRAQHGRPWTPEQEADLANLYAQGKPIQEIAAALQRTPNGIRTHLKKMGLLAQ